MYYVYLVTNLVNEKVYVGQTSLTPEERLKSHFYSRNTKKTHFQAAIRKYGIESFVVQELGRYETQEEVNDAEALWIAILGSCERSVGYNMTYGGNAGGRPTPETKAKIGAASKGRRHSPETRQKMSEDRAGENNAFFGKKHKPETIDAMKEKCREALSGENNPWFGKTLTPEHREKISLAQKGRKQPPRSEETCRRLSEAATARWARWRAERALQPA